MIFLGNHSTNNTEDIDYYTSYSSPYGLIFPAYSTTITFELKIVNDSRLERNELFRIAAISPELPGDQVFSEPDIIILDDDGMLHINLLRIFCVGIQKGSTVS